MTIELQAEQRKTGRAAAREVLQSKKIPAVVYGPDISAEPIAVNRLDFERLYSSAGESTLIDLTRMGKDPLKVLIQDIQRDPFSNLIQHADFRQINMSEKMTVAVKFEFVGEASAVKDLGGTLVKAMDEVEVRCLPSDLVGSIKVDISPLKEFDAMIHIRDLVVPSGIEILSVPEAVIVKVAAPLTEDQLKAMEAAGPVDITKIEIAGKKKEEEAAEGEEGEAGAAAPAKAEGKQEKEKK